MCARPFGAPAKGGGIREPVAGYGSITYGVLTERRRSMVTLGVILLIVGLILGPPVLTALGAVLVVVGLVLNLMPIGGSTRRIW